MSPLSTVQIGSTFHALERKCLHKATCFKKPWSYSEQMNISFSREDCINISGGNI